MRLPGATQVPVVVSRSLPLKKHASPGPGQGRHAFSVAISSSASKYEAGSKNQYAAPNYLQDRKRPLCAKVPVANGSNDDQFDSNDNIGDNQCQAQVLDEKWECMPSSTEKGHEAGN